ncbi:MAG: GNAT family N-acetyltransferase [Solirubrobacterales bacterium]
MSETWLARPDEYAAVARLLCEFRDWWGYGEPTDSEMAARVERLMSAREAEFLLAGTPDDPVGVCQLRYRYGVWLGAPDCWLEDLFVREPERGRGVGRALAETAIARARERGCRRIELDVNDANPAALALYEGLGFGAWVERAGGRNMLMRLRL